MNRGTKLAYGSAKWTKGAQKFSVFTNILDGDANGLLSFGADGRPIPFQFNTRTFDAEYGNVITIGTRQVISFGGNVRYNSFDLSLAPRGDSRSEGGVYVQDEIFINDYLRWVVGARLDRFSVLDKPNFSPRTAIIVKPTADHALRFSFNRAFRAPSLINNFLEVGIVNQLDLRAINPAFAFAPGGPVYNFPVRGHRQREPGRAAGRRLRGRLHRRHQQARHGHGRVLLQQVEGRHLLHAGRAATAPLSPPPAGWPSSRRSWARRPPLGILEVLPPSCIGRAHGPCNTGGLPSEFSYLQSRLGRRQGLRAGRRRAPSTARSTSLPTTPTSSSPIRTSTSRK